MYTHSQNKPKMFKQMLSVCQKSDDNRFLGQEWCADGRIHATRGHNNVRNVLQNTKKQLTVIQNKRRGMLTYGVVLLHVNALPHTAVRTRGLLEHFNWELFDHTPYSPVLAPSDYHLFTRNHLKSWLASTVMSC
jgi:hypothetical protein